MEKKHIVLLSALVLVLVVLVLHIFSGFLGNITGKVIASSEEAQTAKCLSGKGVIVYLAKSECSDCGKQREVFGNAFALVNNVECASKTCAGLKQLPAWKIGNEYYYGLKTIDELKKLSRC